MEEIKELPKSWEEHSSKNITFIVTKDCQILLPRRQKLEGENDLGGSKGCN